MHNYHSKCTCRFTYIVYRTYTVPCEYTQGLNWTSTVHLWGPSQCTLHVNRAEHDARALYTLHLVQHSVRLSQTACALCSARCACNLYCAPSAPLRDFIVHSKFILCTSFAPLSALTLQSVLHMHDTVHDTRVVDTMHRMNCRVHLQYTVLLHCYLTVCTVHSLWTSKCTCTVHRTRKVPVSSFKMYTANELSDSDFIFSVHCNCTVHQCLHLQRTMHVHGASVSALTMHTVRELCTANYTKRVRCTWTGPL